LNKKEKKLILQIVEGVKSKLPYFVLKVFCISAAEPEPQEAASLWWNRSRIRDTALTFVVDIAAHVRR
jgi:hypothetical protein